jgi:uncharacterized protein (DUF4415 family)
MANTTSTDWHNTDATDDDDLDMFDFPPLTPSFFENDKAIQPQSKVHVSLAVDIDVLKWFRAQGPDWEKRMMAALRLYMDAHTEGPAQQ